MTSATARRPEPVAVRRWGELRGERKLASALRVLVAGQSVGGAERTADGRWGAYWYTAGCRDRYTDHGTAEDAVATVVASGLARKLGARSGSTVYWSDLARRTARRGGGR